LDGSYDDVCLTLFVAHPGKGEKSARVVEFVYQLEGLQQGGEFRLGTVHIPYEDGLRKFSAHFGPVSKEKVWAQEE